MDAIFFPRATHLTGHAGFHAVNVAIFDLTFFNVTLHAQFSVAFKPLIKRGYPRNVRFIL